MSTTIEAAMGERIEHAYGLSTPYSVGIEEEFQLVHNETCELVSRVDEILGVATPADHRQIKPELMQSVIETATKVCKDMSEAEQDLRSMRRRIADLAGQNDCQIASSGTHPFSRYEFQKVTDRERYTDIVSRLKWVAQRELIYGLHVHVGIDSPDKAIAVYNGIRAYLPEILALSVNSPFWQGRHTGLQSSRIKIFDSFPRSGLPQAFASWDEYEQLITRMIRIGAMEDYTFVWWDVRPHPRFGTIEVRVCDAQTRVEDSLALAALVQATCAWLGRMYDEGKPIPSYPRLLINENKWSATRYGLAGNFIDFRTDTTVTTVAAIEQLIETVEPFSAELGAQTQFAQLATMLQRSGAQRQLELYDASESLLSVAQMLVRETNA